MNRVSYGGLPKDYNPWPDDPEKWEWAFERIYKLGRRSYHGFPADGGIRMMCEKLAAKVTKGIPLIENDIRYLEGLEKTD